MNDLKRFVEEITVKKRNKEQQAANIAARTQILEQNMANLKEPKKVTKNVLIKEVGKRMLITIVFRLLYNYLVEQFEKYFNANKDEQKSILENYLIMLNMIL